ncbi:MAG: tryptophan--tRNA ligase [Patescibacteria group bacterium]
MSKKVLLSGIQPSGKPHIGNYFGLMKRIVEYQNEYHTYFFIADYHALNSFKDKKTLKDNIINIVIDYLAIGLDPKKSIIFKQSDVSEHTELAWIFETITTMPYLERAHAYKDAKAKGKEVNVGLFNYPMLMAADILLYNTDIVPTGRDQEQHVEIARDTAEKFNNKFGETFSLPQSKIAEIPVVPGLDGCKMSKSYDNTIPLFAEYEEIKKCVMSIVTDSGEGKGEGKPKNVYAIHSLLRPASELDPIYESKKGKYKELKELLIEDLEKFIAPLRERRKEFAKDIPKALAILKEGGERAKKVASAKMDEVREKVGVNVYEKL